MGRGAGAGRAAVGSAPLAAAQESLDHLTAVVGRERLDAGDAQRALDALMEALGQDPVAGALRELDAARTSRDPDTIERAAGAVERITEDLDDLAGALDDASSELRVAVLSIGSALEKTRVQARKIRSEGTVALNRASLGDSITLAELLRGKIDLPPRMRWKDIPFTTKTGQPVWVGMDLGHVRALKEDEDIGYARTILKLGRGRAHAIAGYCYVVYQASRVDRFVGIADVLIPRALLAQRIAQHLAAAKRARKP